MNGTEKKLRGGVRNVGLVLTAGEGDHPLLFVLLGNPNLCDARI